MQLKGIQPIVAHSTKGSVSPATRPPGCRRRIFAQTSGKEMEPPDALSFCPPCHLTSALGSTIQSSELAAGAFGVAAVFAVAAAYCELSSNDTDLLRLERR